jgi:hypothetical protein
VLLFNSSTGGNKMKQHKWHKEIKAWADGAEIERFSEIYPEAGWQEFDGDWGNIEGWDFRIKPQPKEPQYINVYGYLENQNVIFIQKIGMPYIGKIKLEVDDA